MNLLYMLCAIAVSGGTFFIGYQHAMSGEYASMLACVLIAITAGYSSLIFLCYHLFR